MQLQSKHLSYVHFYIEKTNPNYKHMTCKRNVWNKLFVMETFSFSTKILVRVYTLYLLSDCQNLRKFYYRIPCVTLTGALADLISVSSLTLSIGKQCSPTVSDVVPFTSMRNPCIMKKAQISYLWNHSDILETQCSVINKWSWCRGHDEVRFRMKTPLHGYLP